MDFIRKITKIVLTGGPGAGKTTALSHLVERVASMGYQIFVVPEASTILHMGGAEPLKMNPGVFEDSVIKTQIILEDSMVKFANTFNNRSVVICDRGVMDSSAFIDEKAWNVVMKNNNWNIVNLRDLRYDAVIHLESSAVEVPHHYTTENNPIRIKESNIAKTIDFNLRKSWMGHPHFRLIKSREDFNEKMNDVVKSVCGFLGEPEPKEIEKKFLVKEPGLIPVEHQKVDVEQYYLKTDNNETLRIRQRGQDGHFVYFLTQKKRVESGQIVELEKQISGKEYFELLETKDESKSVIKKTRTCFMYEGMYYELDHITCPVNLHVLEVEIDNINDNPVLPPFIEIIEDVTNKLEWSNFAISSMQAELF